ncbi:Ubiquitin-conjugating enzyme E2 T [Bagarius yarrelli]|uniref:Ubiquitin-conjugating enzyme E2 T n=1 Tax=Bagarius yarrelli TaxID=175774 RepID=A0A556U2J5_BAGYA|nr:Ubiquitin-conjugating enzyme E2 T [Bagarius yarrelli]
MQRNSRLKRELQMLSTEPPPGVSCWQLDGKVEELQAQIVGGANTPYDGGLFTVEIKIPDRYPFEPPKMRFLTPIYHPNIDNAGRICLDVLKLPPKSSELKYNKVIYLEKAQRWTAKYAMQKNKVCTHLWF